MTTYIASLGWALAIFFFGCLFCWKREEKKWRRFQRTLVKVVKLISFDEKIKIVANNLKDGDKLRLLLPRDSLDVADSKDIWFVIERNNVYMNIGEEYCPYYKAINDGKVTTEMLDTVLTSYLTE